MPKDTLLGRLTRLQEQIDKAKQFHDGEQLAQRIEGDLDRIMNSAFLNLTDAISHHNRITGKEEHICMLNQAFNSNRCMICGDEIQELGQ